MKHVVEEPVLFVPQVDAVAARIAHGAGDFEEVFKELRCDVLVDRPVERQFERDAQQVQRVHRHPRGAVGLFEVTVHRQLRAAVEHADVVEPQEAALEQVESVWILAIHPPREVDDELVQDPLKEIEVAGAAPLHPVDLEDAPRGPRVHRRIGVAEGPLVGGQLPVAVHVPFPRQQE